MIASFLDHYDHYRRKVGCGPINAFYRAVYHQATGRDWIRR